MPISFTNFQWTYNVKTSSEVFWEIEHSTMWRWTDLVRFLKILILLLCYSLVDVLEENIYIWKKKNKQIKTIFKSLIITWRLYFPATSSNFALSAASLGNWMCTDARIVVPKFVGQKVKKPKRSWCENGSLFSTSFTAVTNRLYTCKQRSNNCRRWNACWLLMYIMCTPWAHLLIDWTQP